MFNGIAEIHIEFRQLVHINSLQMFVNLMTFKYFKPE